MRFAIALLTVICIASVIGTVLKQHEPAANYVNQFGPFWADLFLRLKLNAVYSAWWFLLILAFLVTSTSLCIARNTPKYLADMRNLQGKHPRAKPEGLPPQGRGRRGRRRPAASARRIGQHAGRRRLEGAPAGAPARGRRRLDGGGQEGRGQQDRLHRRAQRHRAGVPGRAAGRRPVRARQMWMGGKSVYAGGGMIADVKPEHRLSRPTPPSAATWWCPRARSPAPPS
jgi:cytochrome c biogenesis protein